MGIVETWKNGKLEPCTVQEFTRGLRRLSGWADQEFSARSDPAAHIGGQLKAAADFIDSLYIPNK